MKIFCTMTAIILFNVISYSQVDGDFQSKSTTGNWSDYNAWNKRVSGSWVAATSGQIPVSTSSVYIQSAHTMTIDNSAAVCNTVNFGATSSKLSFADGTCVLSVYGDFILNATTHTAFSTWPDGAILKFKGGAAQQITNLNTSVSTNNQTFFKAIIVDKSADTLRLPNADVKLNIVNSLEIVNGSFVQGETADIQGRSFDGSTATTPTITVQSGGTFFMWGTGSHIGSGSTGTPRPPIGKLTVNGKVTLATASTNWVNFSSIDINNGGIFNINSGLWTTGYLNGGTITVYSGGKIINTATTNVYSTTSTPPTSLVINLGGIFSTSASTTPLPAAPYFTNNGTFLYNRNSGTQNIVDMNYNRVEFSLSPKAWALVSSRIVADSLEINNSAALTITSTGSNSLTINGTLRLTSGSIDNSGAGVTLAMGSGVEISRATGTITNAPSFSSVNLKYTSTTTSVTTGPEMPSSSSALNNLILSGSKVITLGSSITVNGTLSFWGTTSLALGGFTLNYGSSAVLQYGTSGQTSDRTTTDVEWPASNGPNNVTIYHTAGTDPVTLGVVTLHDNRTIPGTLTLTLGTFDNNGSANDKTLSLGDGATIKRSSGLLSAVPTFAGKINLIYNSGLSDWTTDNEMPSSPSSALNNLNISTTSGHKVTLGSDINVTGTLTISGTFDANSRTVTITGPGLAWNNTGSFTYGTSKIKMNGSAAQTMQGSTFYDLEIDNAAGVSLLSSDVVTHQLILTRGPLDLGANSLSLNSGASIVGNGGSAMVNFNNTNNNFVVTSSSGVLKQNVGSSDVLFPIGYSSALFNPAILNNSGGTADDYSVKVATGTGAPTTGPNYVNKRWTITEAVSPGSNLIMTFQWNASDELGGSRSAYIIGVDNGASIFENMITHPYQGSNPYSIQNIMPFTLDMTGGKVFTIGEPSSLPVELSTFTSTVNERDVLLNWETKTEKNSNKFEIERMINLTWANIGNVKASVLSNSPKRYSFIDKNLQTGKYQYRLKMIDNDGSFQFSKIVETEVSIPKNFSLSQNYPNPFNPETNIRFEIPKASNVNISIFNIIGEKVATLLNEYMEAGYYQRSFSSNNNGVNLSSGTYFYVLKAGETNIVKKMILMK